MSAARQYTLLNPGPVNVSATVRQALMGPDLCHREPEYGDLQQSIRTRLLSVVGVPGADYTAVLLTGSGTAMVEAAVSSIVSPSGRMLVLRNGVYGDRLAAIARAHGIAHDTLDADWTAVPSLDALAARLGQARYEVVAVVHHETTTGLLNPVESIGPLVKQAGARMVVDSVSGLGGERFDLVATGADIVVSTANKCFQGLPGISFAIVRREVMERMAGYPARSVYLHLPGHFAAQEQHSTAFTPAVQVAYAFEAALVELADETIERRVARYRHAASIIRDGLEALGLPLLLPPDRRSGTITAVGLPPGMPYAPLHDALKEEGFVIYAGQGRLAAEIFRVATMGQVPEAEYRRFVAVLGAVLAR